MSDRVVHIVWSDCSCCSSSSERIIFPISEVSFVSTSSSYRWTRLFLLAVLSTASALVGVFVGVQVSTAVVIPCLAVS